MGIAFSIASETRFPGIAYTGRNSNDVLSTTRPVIIAKAGTSSFGDNSERQRWGDYSGLALDPDDQRTFWLFNEFSAGACNLRNWGTFGASFKCGCCDGVVAPRQFTINRNIKR